MGELKEKMARDLALRNLAAGTQKQYLSCCCNFVRYHMVTPRKLGLGDIKDFLGQLLREAASPQKIKMHVAGIKFLYGTTLDRQQVADKIPWPKVADTHAMRIGQRVTWRGAREKPGHRRVISRSRTALNS